MKGNIQKVRSLKTPEFWLKVRLKVKFSHSTIFMISKTDPSKKGRSNLTLPHPYIDIQSTTRGCK